MGFGNTLSPLVFLMIFLGSWGIKEEGMKKIMGSEGYEWFLAVLLYSSVVSQQCLKMRW